MPVCIFIDAAACVSTDAAVCVFTNGWRRKQDCNKKSGVLAAPDQNTVAGVSLFTNAMVSERFLLCVFVSV